LVLPPFAVLAPAPHPAAPPPPTVVAMAQCWYTREHRPAQNQRPREDGRPVYARCCHCHRDISSLNGRLWEIAGGFNAEAAGHSRARAFLSVVDVVDEMVIARFPIGAIPDEAGVQALRARLRLRYGLDEPASTLVLRDSRQRAMMS
jgi:hypothetical protein